MSDELTRLATLRAYAILDTPPEASFDDLVRLAAHICRAPIAVLTLIDDGRQWFKAQIGLPVRESPRSAAFCDQTIRGDRPLVITDARRDPRFRANPFVAGEPHVAFYAGAPLIAPDGSRLGALAVMDRSPRKLGATELDLLQSLARQAMSLLELRRERDEAERLRQQEALRQARIEAEESGHYRVEDVTEFVRSKERAGEGAEGWRALESRMEQMEIDILLRSRELQRLNEQLRASEARFHGVFNDAATGIVMGSPDGEIIEVNPAFCRMLGYSCDELAGRPWPSLLHPDERAHSEQLIAELRAQRRESFVRELRLLARSGEVVWSRISASAPHDGAGKVANLIFVTEDISQQREAEARVGATLERMSDAFYLLDSQWRFAYLNGEAERLLRRRREELLGEEIWAMFPEARASVLFEAYRRAVRQQRPEQFELYYPPLQHWFDVSAYPSPEGLAVYFRAITEHKRREALLAESEERFRLVAQATVDTIWDWNLKTDEIWWSSGLQAQFGYGREEFGRGLAAWSSRVHPADIPEALNSLFAVLHGEANEWEHRYRFRRADRSFAEVIDRGFVIRDGEGRAARMVGGMTDVTERLALEAQLRQAQRLEAVGQLTGGVAHDFNNLLTVILGNAELLADELEQAPEQRALAEMVLGAAQRGAELTGRLLAFARRQPLDPKNVDVNQLIAGMDDLLRRTLGEHMEITLRLAPDLWQALVDRVQLESALLNLSINARDAMAGGGELTIATANAVLDEGYAGQHIELQPGEYVLLTVSDTGAGIAPEHLAQVFEPFFTTKPKGKGTGLGLSMVYGFMKQSRGHINLASEAGKGTTVRLFLPRAAGERAAEAAGPAEGAHAGRGELILLVEDDELVRRFAQQLLLELGYQVLTAANGPEALAIIRERAEIALLFTDIVMPGGMSGRALAAAARALRPQLRLLYTSGYADDALTVQERGGPQIQLLSKPYLRSELARKVREALGAPQRS